MTEKEISNDLTRFCRDIGDFSDDLRTVMQNVMTQFVNSLDYQNGDTAEIITFDTYIMFMCMNTNDASLLDNGIQNMSTYGDTALYDALITGIQSSGSRSGARCVIGFTDGEDNSSPHTYQEVIALSQQMEVPVYIIGTASADSAILQEITTQTGGKYWSIDVINDMSEIMNEIYGIQKDMYCIEYDSDSSADATAERSVSCVQAGDEGGAELDNVTFTPKAAAQVAPHTSRYEVVKEDCTWIQANNECMAKGGHLVTITSQEEEDKVSQMAQDAGLQFVWMGGYTSEKDDQVYGHWVTGEPFSYSAWYPNEPSRDDKDGTPEFYLMLWNVDNAWTWNDQRDDIFSSGLKYFTGKTGYICEYEDMAQ